MGRLSQGARHGALATGRSARGARHGALVVGRLSLGARRRALIMERNRKDTAQERRENKDLARGQVSRKEGKTKISLGARSSEQREKERFGQGLGLQEKRGKERFGQGPGFRKRWASKRCKCWIFMASMKESSQIADSHFSQSFRKSFFVASEFSSGFPA